MDDESHEDQRFFSKYPRSIGWLPKFWWGSNTSNLKMPMVNGPNNATF